MSTRMDVNLICLCLRRLDASMLTSFQQPSNGVFKTSWAAVYEVRYCRCVVADIMTFLYERRTTLYTNNSAELTALFESLLFFKLVKGKHDVACFLYDSMYSTFSASFPLKVA